MKNYIFSIYINKIRINKYQINTLISTEKGKMDFFKK